MDERVLFDQFHEALNEEPRPGAYERMRVAMTSQPVALKRRPVFRMRWSKMGLRVAAVVAAAVIAVAMGAVILASHHGPTGSVNARPDQNVVRYQAMMESDYNTMNASTSNSCNTIQDSTCAAAINVVIPTLQHWLDDLNSTRTPAGYVVIDSALRSHLAQAIADLNGAVAFQKANNQKGFDLSMSAASYERAWIDPAAFSIEGFYPVVAASFHVAVGQARQSIYGCVNLSPGPADISCTHLLQGEACTGTAAQICESDVQAASTEAETILIGLSENPAPTALASKDARLQTDLVQADAALLDITKAVLSGDSAKAAAAQTTYSQAITAAHDDIDAMGIV